jgi:hypothetical protein
VLDTLWAEPKLSEIPPSSPYSSEPNAFDQGIHKLFMSTPQRLRQGSPTGSTPGDVEAVSGEGHDAPLARQAVVILLGLLFFVTALVLLGARIAHMEEPDEQAYVIEAVRCTARAGHTA